MIKRVFVDHRGTHVRATVLFDDGTKSKARGNTTKQAVRNAVETAKKEKGMPIERCVGCDYYDKKKGCMHPEERTVEFAKIPLDKCYSSKGEKHGEK